MNKIVLFVTLLFAFEMNDDAQIKNIGVPYICNFTKRMYNGGTENWSITQDSRGVIFVGNSQGLLEYDGNVWKLYELPNFSSVRAVQAGNQGRIYVGGNQEFGYFFPNKQGIMRYNSLLKKLPVEKQQVGEICHIHETHYGIVFQTPTSIIICNDTLSAKIVLQSGTINNSFYINNALYISDNDSGLLKYDGKTIRKVTGGATFANKKVVCILPFERYKLLVGTVNDGLFKLDQFGAEKSAGLAHDFLVTHQLHAVIKIDKLYAASTNNGVMFFDQEGNPIQHLNASKGLQNNTVHFSFLDKNRNLWLALDNGIDYVEISSAISYLNKNQYIGSGYASVYFKNKLYLATNQGLYATTQEALENPFNDKGFDMVANTAGNVWNIAQIDNKLMCSSNIGTIEINNDVANVLTTEAGRSKYIQFPDVENKMVGGTNKGLALFTKGTDKDSVWKFTKIIEGFSAPIHEMEIDRDGYLWINNSSKGIYRLLLNEALDSMVSVDYYDATNGLPSDYFNGIFTLNSNVYIATQSGIYELDKLGDVFKKNTALTQLLGDARIDKLYEDANGNKWFFQNQELKVLRLNYEGNYRIEVVALGEYKGLFMRNFEAINFIDNKNILLSTYNGFIHFDPTLVRRESDNSAVMLRSVKSFGDTVVFGGNFVNADGMVVISRSSNQVARFNYRLNALKFEFSDNTYDTNSQMLFRTYLEGYDKGWSEYSTEKMKYYPKLHTGKYMFHLRGKRENGAETTEVNFEFVIVPPWYLSIWAYVVYSLLVLLGVWYLAVFCWSKFKTYKANMFDKQHVEWRTQNDLLVQNAKIAELEIAKLHNEKVQLELHQNWHDASVKSRELANFAMQLTYKNEMLADIKERLEVATLKLKHDDAKAQITNVLASFEKDLSQTENWEKFETNFDQVHEDFFKKLKIKYPDLTYKDLRLCAYLRMNLASKDIAALLNISIRGVEISRYRLRKKVAIDKSENLNDYLMHI